MLFKRKIYDKLLNWKNNYADSYSLLIEGARRVGKSTVVEQFAKQEYESYIMVDFVNASKDVIECFEDIHNTDLFLLRLQAVTNTQLHKGNSLIVFDEIQMFPKAREALKFLVRDTDYHFIATGSLISIKKNVKDILIPSEEKHIQMYPMDYEEFMLATGNQTTQLFDEILRASKPIGESVNRKLLRDYRIYMAVGGMPQAVKAYIEGKSFAEIDEIKRDIIRLYEEDLKKIDSSGKLGMIYKSIPAQLSKNSKRFIISRATNKKKTPKDDNRIFDLIDSKIALICNNCTDPKVSLSLTKDLDSYKLFLADTGLFVTLLFMDRPSIDNELYSKLLSNKLPANLGYLYENAIAQAIASTDRELYYHTWRKKDSTHQYEVDFLIADKTKITALEVKSSGNGKHESLSRFKEKYSKNIKDICVVSQKDYQIANGIKYIPIYLLTSFLNSN